MADLWLDPKNFASLGQGIDTSTTTSTAVLGPPLTKEAFYGGLVVRRHHVTIPPEHWVNGHAGGVSYSPDTIPSRASRTRIVVGLCMAPRGTLPNSTSNSLNPDRRQF